MKNIQRTKRKNVKVIKKIFVWEMHEHECNKMIEGTKKLTSGSRKVNENVNVGNIHIQFKNI